MWYGSVRVWTTVQTSSTSVRDLLFGEFDDIKGTDVAAVTNREWVISSAATGQWTRLNAKLTNSFRGAVAADFDGNGQTDIAVSSGGKWRFSADGRAPSAVLRNSRETIDKPLIGRFDGGTKAMAIRFEIRASVNPIGERLVIWRGLGRSSSFVAHSRQNMR